MWAENSEAPTLPTASRSAGAWESGREVPPGRASRSTWGQSAALVAAVALVIVPLAPASADDSTDGHRGVPVVGMDRPGVIPDAYLVLLATTGTDRADDVEAEQAEIRASAGRC